MQVKCVLCDAIEDINDESLKAKQIKNHKKILYLCDHCYTRIGKKTNDRHATGNFNLYREKENNDLI